MRPGPGDPAPPFILQDEDGKKVSSGDKLGKWLVLYFYPKDFTPGCTIEACKFRDQYEEFLEKDAIVVGVSNDENSRHKEFKEKYNMPYELLSDPDGRVRALYGVRKKWGFIPGRVTFLIDPQGVIRFVYDSQADVNGHVTKTMAFLEEARK